MAAFLYIVTGRCLVVVTPRGPTSDRLIERFGATKPDATGGKVSNIPLAVANELIAMKARCGAHIRRCSDYPADVGRREPRVHGEGR
jgi:hypothetical protein